jgi:hemolysin activation/secretion protein
LLLLLTAQIFFSFDIDAQTTNATVKTPASTTNAAPGFKVEKYLVSGNTVLEPKKLGGIFTNVPDSFGTNVTIANIRDALGELQMAYRERGYVTVSVGLPPQKLTNATVKIKVTEGRLSDINVQGNDWFSTENVLRALPGLHTNMLLNSHVFQRELDMANASRDRQIYPVIGPGLEPGTSELTLKVKDRFPAHARVEFNNLATPGTPDNRVAFNSQYDNLWQLEHQVGLQYTFTPLDYASLQNYYFSPIDLPLIANYSAYYRLPLGRPVSVQEQIDASNGRFGYNEVTHQFQMPPPTGRPELTIYTSRSVSDSGVIHSSFTNVISTPLLTIDSDDTGHNVTLNEGIGAKLSWPLPPVGKLNTTLTLGADFKHYEQVSYNSNNFYATTYVTNSNGSVSAINSTVSSAQPELSTAVEYFPVNIGFSGLMPDAWGTTAFNVQANFNLAAFDGLGRSGTNVTHGGLSNVSPGTKDNYVTVQMGADRLQTLYKDWTMKIHADGQWANQALFSNEQYGMGGTGGVRGYPDGQGYGDTGWRMSVEPQTPLINIGMVDGDVPFWIRASVFMDYGQIYALDGRYFVKTTAPNGFFVGSIPGNPSHLDYWGTGWSLVANIGNHLDARLTMAFPLINEDQLPGWSPLHDLRIYFAVGAQF